MLCVLAIYGLDSVRGDVLNIIGDEVDLKARLISDQTKTKIARGLHGQGTVLSSNQVRGSADGKKRRNLVLLGREMINKIQQHFAGRTFLSDFRFLFQSTSHKLSEENLHGLLQFAAAYVHGVHALRADDRRL